LADLILGGLLIFYACLALYAGHPYAALVISACAVVVLGDKLHKELSK